MCPISLLQVLEIGDGAYNFYKQLSGGELIKTFFLIIYMFVYTGENIFRPRGLIRAPHKLFVSYLNKIFLMLFQFISYTVRHRWLIAEFNLETMRFENIPFLAIVHKSRNCFIIR